MSSSFADLVEEVKTLSVAEKEGLQQLIEKYLTEERRDEILENSVHSLSELGEGKLEFSSDTNALNGLLKVRYSL